MQKYHVFLEKLNDRVLTQDLDRVQLVLGDEGHGKSTLMAETIILFERDVKGRELTTADVLDDHIVWSDPDELREKMVNLPDRSCIAVMDAARLLNKKEAMKEEQKEIEKDLFDARAFNHLLLLGFQNPNSVPDDLATRRAKSMVVLPRRGRLLGFSRAKMDEYDFEDYRPESLPDPDLRDSFPALDGTDFWDAFQQRDEAKKKERIAPDAEDDDGPAVAHVVAETILNERDRELAWFISRDGRSGELYLDPDMIALEYEVTQREAEQVRKLLRREDRLSVDPERVVLEGERIAEVEQDADEGDDQADEGRSLHEIAEEVHANLVEFIGEDGRTGDFLLDPDKIAFEYELSDRKARQVRKAVEDFEDVSVNDEVVSKGGEVVASKIREA